MYQKGEMRVGLITYRYNLVKGYEKAEILNQIYRWSLAGDRWPLAVKRIS